MSLKKNGESAGDAGVASSASSSGAGVSVVIPVYNQLDYTRKCLDSLRAHGGGIEEIIIIDNGSTDGTAQYLSGLDSATVIMNRENLGCAAAWNQGVEAAGSAWVLFLNNDVVVTSHWIEGMLEFAEEKRVDIVSPAIREGAGDYDMDRYAQEFVARMGRQSRIGVADGICFLVRRAVFEKVGRFDEHFRIGQFEDVDFFRRAAMAGFRLGITGRSFIHHFGSVTQNHIRGVERNNSYEAVNRAYYRRKWNLSWPKRFIDRQSGKARLFFWTVKERALGGHTLKEAVSR
ncbi:MAG: glycosyltransferase family 2 protein [Deltaproteobacteria bacterium]|jgi:GT2 family glycosyltransferase|nr:glycosyltransferase family 2 protein [Deltaproteobacteria bacterium]